MPDAAHKIADAPGTAADQPDATSGQETGAPGGDPVRREIRVTNLYATPWHLALAPGGDLADYLELWRFDRYYRLSADQLPRVLTRETLDVSALRFRRWQPAGRVTGARIWLFGLPSGQIVAALSLDVRCELADTIALLEDCYFTDVQIGAATAEQYAHAMATRAGAGGGADQGFLPERHQIVFGQAPTPDDCEDLVQRLIYRTDLPYRKEYSAIRYPRELNCRPGWLTAVGPYVSVVCGHPDFLPETPSRSIIAATCRRTVVVLIPARPAIASSFRPSAISSRTAC